MPMIHQDLRQPSYHRIYGNNYMSCGEAEQRFGVTFEKCPFCFNPYPVIFLTDRHSQVCCEYCGAEGPPSSYKGFEGIPNAVAKWNNRLAPEVPELKGTQ